MTTISNILQTVTSNRVARLLTKNSLITGLAIGAITAIGKSLHQLYYREEKNKKIKAYNDVAGPLKKHLGKLTQVEIKTDDNDSSKTQIARGKKIGDLTIKNKKNESALHKKTRKSLKDLKSRILSVIITAKPPKIKDAFFKKNNPLEKYKGKDNAVATLRDLLVKAGKKKKGLTIKELYQPIISAANFPKVEKKKSDLSKGDKALNAAIKHASTALKDLDSIALKNEFKNDTTTIKVLDEIVAIQNSLKKADERTLKNDFTVALKLAAIVGVVFSALLYATSSLSTRHIIKQ